MAELLHKLLHCYDSRVRVQNSQGNKKEKQTIKKHLFPGKIKINAHYFYFIDDLHLPLVS